jgi:hypothetical protein
MFTKLHYILNWERAAPWPPQLGRAGSRGLADACWADSYTVWSPAQPATPQLHSSSSTPCLHTLAWEGGRKKPGLPSQCSTGLHNPAECHCRRQTWKYAMLAPPKPITSHCWDASEPYGSQSKPVIAGMPMLACGAHSDNPL